MATRQPPQPPTTDEKAAENIERVDAALKQLEIQQNILKNQEDIN